MGIVIDAERFARRALHTEVTREGFGFRHLALSRSGRPPLDAPAQPAAVPPILTLRARAPYVGRYLPRNSTAARALMGRSYAPSAPRAGQGTS